MFVIALTLGAIVGFSALGYVVAIAASAPELGKPVNRGLTSSVYAVDGSLLGYIQSDEISTPLAWSNLPQDCKDATVAIEDERFYKHTGVDYSAIVRAAVRNLTSGKTVQGGSTITMQLVRNLYIAEPKRDYKRKIREAKLASELEQEHSKRWILQAYLNTAPYGTVGGQSAMGVQAASQTFFAKNAKDIGLSECALLAGLPQAPSEYNPFLNPKGAIERRNEVLAKMAELGYITDSEKNAAIAEPVRVKRGTRYTRIREPYFFDYVKQRLIDKYGINTMRRGGLKVYTTIDRKLQDAARAAINSTLSGPSGAIVAIDPRTGHIRTMASSGGYGQSQFNLAAQGHRQPGSSFKTMALVTALRQGIDPESTTYNSHPINIKSSPWGPIKVKTYSNSYSGNINLVRATTSSDNAVYIQLAMDVGPKNVRDTARLLGIRSKLNGYPAESLGGLERGVSPLEMSRAYATISAGGVRAQPEAIEKVIFPGGKTDDIGKPQRVKVLKDGVTFEATKILRANVTGGTGTGTRNYFTCPAAGKTGTTDNFKDAWFVGYTPVFSAAVWVGYPDAGISMPGMAGGTAPATIWGKFMAKAQGDHCKEWPEPKEPFEGHTFSGKYATLGKKEGGGPTGEAYSEGKKKKKKDKNDGKNDGGKDNGDNKDPETKPPKQTPAEPAPAPAPTPAPDTPGAVAPG
ncbi:MAG: transglycosylase domain-containing protein [Actinobacteria bacterium]|nr:transglycosylase domain-containing protein [Actinomycetota bacterium]